MFGTIPGTRLDPSHLDERPLPPLPRGLDSEHPRAEELTGEYDSLPRQESWHSAPADVPANVDVSSGLIDLSVPRSIPSGSVGSVQVSLNSPRSPALGSSRNSDTIENLRGLDFAALASHSSSVPVYAETERTTSPPGGHPTAERDPTRQPSSPISPPPPFTQSQTRRPPQVLRQYRGEQAEFGVPRWQPDIEVTICPICGTQFSFFVRKHHCRKCGRVVCNSCSPHRIVIPYPYIVRPPTETDSAISSDPRPQPRTDLTRMDSSADVEGLGGGERVRLCNPCVPDPNIAPPQSVSSIDQDAASLQSRHARSVSAASAPYDMPPSTMQNSSREPLNFSRRPRQPSILGNRSPRGASYQSGQERLLRPEVPGNRSRSNTLGNTNSGYTADPSNDVSSATTQQHYRSLLPRSETETRSSLRPMNQHQPRIAEEDECPVCHRELPLRTLPNYEGLREDHIQSCINDFMTPSSSVPRRHDQARSQSSRGESSSAGLNNTSQITGSNSMLPLRGNTPEARMAAREQAHAAVVFGAQSNPNPVRRTGIFPYIATEKDCVDDAECTICLEEFEVGAEMARLECFCRFHLKCIREWFVTRPGQCPVHQHGAGY